MSLRSSVARSSLRSSVAKSSLRSSFVTLALATVAAGCGSAPTEMADVGLRRLGEGDVQVTVDSVVGHFDPTTITWAAFTVKNVSAHPVLVAGCIEGLAAKIEREVNGAWQFVGGNWCWGSEPRHGFPLAAGASFDGAMQTPEPGRYRVVVRFATEAERDVAYDVASAPFEAR